MTDAAIEFRAYRPEDRAQILALLAIGRPPTYPPAKAAVFDWQFAGNPLAAAHPPYLVGTLGDEIVAVNGLVPVHVRFGGARHVACWSLDTYVSAAHRGRGFGKALIARMSREAPVMLGFGISDMSDPILEKAGWRSDPAEVRFFYAKETGLKGFAKNLRSRRARSRRAPAADPPIAFALESAPRPDELDALWTRVAPQFPNAVERTGAYLIWRYRDAPVLRYRWLTARLDGELRAALVTRHAPGESIIADYVGPLDDADLLTSLLDAGLTDLTTTGTRRVRCESNHPAMLDALGTAGFVRYRVGSRFRVFASAPATDAPWFVMTGDSDNDLLAP